MKIGGTPTDVAGVDLVAARMNTFDNLCPSKSRHVEPASRLYDRRIGRMFDLQSQRAAFQIIDPAPLKAPLLQIFYEVGVRAGITVSVVAKHFPIRK